MEKPILNRFKIAVTYLVKNKLATSKKEIAASIGQSPSNFSEILKGRVKLNAEVLQTFLIKWPINPMFLHYLSDEVDASRAINHSDSSIPKGVSIDQTISNKNLDVLLLINNLKSETISDTDRNNIADELAKVIAQLLDENSKLKSDLLASIIAGN